MALSPLARRRWAIFRSTRRGYLSAVFLVFLVGISMLAELLCNSHPLVVRYQGEWRWPLFTQYTDADFGGAFATEADFHDPALVAQLAAPGNFALWPPVHFDYQTIDTQLASPAPSPPDRSHPLGTDDRGRDVLARLIYGFRLSVVFGLVLAVSGSVLGVLVGAVQGYIGGLFDLLGQRVVEIWSAQNELYLLIILASIFEPSVTLIFLLLSLFGWMGLAAYVRAEFLRARQYEFVQAAVALGSPRWQVMLRHILPNTMTPVVTFFPFRVAAGIMGLTALDFLSLGVPPPTPSLGELLSQGKSNLQSWWIIVSVFVVLTLLLTLLNFIGEAVQRALDPKTSLGA